MYIKNNIKSKGGLNISKFYLIDFSNVQFWFLELGTRGKPSTWFPRGELSEQINKKKQHNTKNKNANYTTQTMERILAQTTKK